MATMSQPMHGGNAHGISVSVSSVIMVASVVVLFCLFVFFLVLYLRSNLNMGTLPDLENSPVYTDGSGGAGARCRALDPAVLKSLPVSIFSSVQSKEVVECAVCISELADGEHFRLLPGCQHSFHIQCIDMWFSSNSTCPICRSSLEPPLKTEVLNNAEATPSVNIAALQPWIGMGRMAMRTDGAEAGSSSSAGSRRPGRIIAVDSITSHAVESSSLSLQLRGIPVMPALASATRASSGCCSRGWDIEQGQPPAAAGVGEIGAGSSSS